MAVADEPEYLIQREVAHTVVLADPDPAWAEAYKNEGDRIRAALGDQQCEVHHVGSTSVTGLAAKPILDVLLLVKDSADEDSYAPALEAAGYRFHVREPHWHEHRLFKSGTPHFNRSPDSTAAGKVNLHVFTVGSEEAAQMLLFRDWLRAHADDRDLYENTKRELAERRWDYIQDYADAKSAVVGEILRRARASAD